jgi:outer membrane assembly lipoprotein YfgL
VAFPLTINTTRDTVTLASSAGSVLALNVRNGQELWRRDVGEALAAGVGSDGALAAVVSRANDLIVLEAGKEIWRQKLVAQVFTAPLVAGGRVFVVSADRTVSAYDGRSGRRLWLQSRPGEPLILRQAGVLLAVGDTLVLGQGGRLVGLNPGNGSVRWEAPIASPRGTNDVERLADLVGRVSREGDVVCARAFQASVGCVNAVRGNLLWTQAANGFEGVHGDAERVVASEADGRIVAWRRTDGQKLWASDRLQYRQLTSPLVLGRSVVLGDGAGLLHFLSREDGSVLTRTATDGSGIAAAPVLVDGTLVVVTRNGRIYGFVPE